MQPCNCNGLLSREKRRNFKGIQKPSLKKKTHSGTVLYNENLSGFNINCRQGAKTMKRRFFLGGFLLLVLAAGIGLHPLGPSSWAKGGGDIKFENTFSFPHVLFSHDKHLETGMQCKTCHDGLFHKKKGSTDKDKALTMKAIRQGKFCGACHNGDKAFSVQGNCKKCHSIK